MKKIILFKVTSLKLGGIERIAIDVLKNIDYSNKKIFLLIDKYDENFLGKELSKYNLEIIYLKSREDEKRMRYVKFRKKNIFLSWHIIF